MMHEMEITYKGRGNLYNRAHEIAARHNVKIVEADQRPGWFMTTISLKLHGYEEDLNKFLNEFVNR